MRLLILLNTIICGAKVNHAEKQRMTIVIEFEGLAPNILPGDGDGFKVVATCVGDLITPSLKIYGERYENSKKQP